uniref:rootletin-like n=1 Tax=Pristiophorus japonicus TaxID=55135 RepID=UPI00398E48C8
DLSEGRADIARLSTALQGTCLTLSGRMSAAETGNTLARARERARAEGLEHDLREKAQDFLRLQITSQAESAELNARVSELSLTIGLLENQVSEKDQKIVALTETVEVMESRRLESTQQAAEMEAIRADVDELQQALRDIAEVNLGPVRQERGQEPLGPLGQGSLTPGRGQGPLGPK